ncbi:MAG: ERF family protein [Gemmatimonadaceae bacterium]|nr:ERF family protein [Gemmatimonadaceae bacterium]
MSEAEKSVSIGSLAKALAAAQAELEDARKDARNPHFNSSYATLASVRAAMGSVLPKHDLAVVQGFEPHGDAGVCVVTTLMHSSGEWIRSALFIPLTKRDAQGAGSAISYGRRYSLAAIVGIATTDDDANEAVKPPARKAPEPGPKLAAGDVDPIVEGHVLAIDNATEVRSLLTIYANVTQDSRLPVAAKEYIVQLLSTKRRNLEGRAA